MLSPSMRKLRPKIMALMGASIVLVGLVAIYCISLLSQQVSEYEMLVEQEVRAATLADKMNLNFKRQVQEWKNVLLRGHDRDQLDKYWGRFNERQEQIQKMANEFLGLPVDNRFKSQMREFQNTHEGLKRKYQKGYDAFLATNFDHKAGDNAVSGIDRAPTKQLEELGEALASAATTHSQQLQSDANTAITITIVIMLLAIVGCLVISSFIMNRMVVHPLVSLITHLRNVSKGQFDKQLLIDNEDEIGRMSRGVETLRIKLLNVCQQMDNTQSQLDEVCLSLSDSANAITRGVSSTNDGTDHALNSMEQLGQMGDDIARNAQEADSAASSANTAADTSIQVMKATIDAITHSSNQIENTSKVIASLDEDANKIGSVLDVIKGIAEQTNLLALNAAIEAARAGEQGRGFAVVADEVRTLAARTQQSTEEIQQMISNVQNGAKSAVEAIEQGQSQTAASVEKVHEADSHLKEVTEAINTIASMNAQIATAIEEQSSITQDIRQNMSELAKVAAENDKHANSCQQDNETLSAVKDRMASAIRQLRSDQV
ncbi:Methyl-accepting chemotaxis protein CtpH [Saliniradius amylolyticus]|uniref:Methyl-accepting chemotaxis protein CtpH n=1 Tax=Saliniradius amylolyticus TaxID=2183582 RepID=A0A2S2E674_9ALTE|nr:HAMP domain-containing methyl-accepting chemotaxis protein [Saliniradius amylolyticus]AWL12740.1 Methyl-accepting chemotaxis protein CtpH [Saliniradius amylolyticus]